MATDTWTLAPAEPDDFGAVASLLRVEEQELGEEPAYTEDLVRIEWTAAGSSLERDTRTIVDAGAIVAVASVRRRGEQVHGHGYVHPEHRGRGFGSLLMRWMLDEARARGAHEFHTWARPSNPSAIALVERFGFEHARTFLTMYNTSPLDVAAPVWPDGIELRPLEGDALLEAVAVAYDASFCDHWNFHPMDRARLEAWLAPPLGDPSLWFVAFAGDEPAGMCLNVLFRRGEDLVGDLGPIGTTRPYRGIGLGRALLRHSVQALAARGARAVELGVDADNPNGALRLYERNGFSVVREGRAYRRSL